MGTFKRSKVVWMCHLLTIALQTNIVRPDLQDMINPMRKRYSSFPIRFKRTCLFFHRFALSQRFLSHRPRLAITSPLSVVIPEGSVFRLVCTATEHVRPPLDFTWIVNDTDLKEAITRLHIRGSVRLENSFGEKSSTSELTVVFAKRSDSGLYK